ncbi:4-hydroxythreonine-4-phosphate dehydrogenase PdxA [Arthrobacter oryzae]|uniref:4-hydroxythreonine-4-phosphate dehydrogenase PdxA n=1 Tax=Arthrobacter oryzae TaxID=409290 RepID=UPI00285B671E|nr:4-hydroxythreonine-4-phosphate dehydrogenase PdxA [Arthrobacter oryzae]MDR6504864.1 4-hydroxythreonine-4-phosphate dehydrogenase [Arthrobacter oryzae]
MTAVLIQADDFSGAAEVGQCFARQGLTTQVLLAPGPQGQTELPGQAAPPADVPTGLPGPAAQPADVVVVDTHSRNLSGEAAAEAVAGVFGGAAAASARVLFKKIDSLWRGNVGPEIGALTGLGMHVVVAGALPQLGRTVVGGKPLVGGTPLDRTGLWAAETAAPPASIRDALQQAEGRAADLLDLHAVRSGKLPAHLDRILSGADPAVVVADGETEADLAAVVDAMVRLDFTAGGRRIVLVGTGGTAELLACSIGTRPARNAQPAKRGAPGLQGDADAGTPAAVLRRNPGPVLAVVGSASGTARNQLRDLEAAGYMLFGLRPEELARPATQQPQAQRAREALSAGAAVALTVAADRVDPGEAGVIVHNLARFVSGTLHGAGPDLKPDLILTGGETAREVLDALGITALEPLDAVQHGAVVSLADDGTLVGTKPGSFGDRHALTQLHQKIRSRRASPAAGLSTQQTLDRPSEKSGAVMNSAVVNETEQDHRPFIAVTMGDGAGVGPEVTVGALLAENAYRDCRPVVIGDVYRLELGAKALGATPNIVEVRTVQEAVFEPGRINVIDPKLLSRDLPWGQESAEAGNAAYHYIRIACELGMKGEVQGICTAPLNKAALHKAGHIYPGHTELLAHFMGIEEVSMMLSTPKVKVIHVTTHIGLIDAINRIEPGLVERTVRRGYEAMQRAGIANPKIGVCAINPHAGENGLFGYGEEAEKITPAIEKLQADGVDARGPLPADTAFFLAGRGDYDLIVAMYHDQGHGPIKVLGIEAGVNITVGLPVIRTSVDHGTAFDIAGKGIVDVRSMIEALRQAAEMSPSPALRK